MLANFIGPQNCTLNHIRCEAGAPVFSVPTTIDGDKASATFTAKVNHAASDILKVFVKGAELTAMQVPEDSCAAYLANSQEADAAPYVCIIANGKCISGQVKIASGKCVKVYVEQDELRWQEAVAPEAIRPNTIKTSTRPTSERVDVYTIGGIKLRENVSPDLATQGLSQGIYIVEGKKVAVP